MEDLSHSELSLVNGLALDDLLAAEGCLSAGVHKYGRTKPKNPADSISRASVLSEKIAALIRDGFWSPVRRATQKNREPFEVATKLSAKRLLK